MIHQGRPAMIHLIGNASELANEGDYIRLPIGIDDVVVMREAGELVAFDNVCTHRGARIHEGLVGNREPVCRYHGRRARADCVNRYQIIVAGYWLFVKVGGEPDDDTEFIGDPTRAIDALLNIGPLERVAMHTQFYGSPWTIAVENALDWTHVSTVHPGSLGRMGIKPIGGCPGPSGSSVELFRADNRALARLAPDNPLPCDYVHLYLAPYACVSSTRGLTVSVQHYLPAGPHLTRFVTRLYAKPGTPRGLATQVHKLNTQVFDEDAAVCASVHPEFIGKGPLSAQEWRIQAFRNVWTPR